MNVRKDVDIENCFFVLGEKTLLMLQHVCKRKDFVRWFRKPDFLSSEMSLTDDFDVQEILNDAEVIVESRSSEPDRLSVVVGDFT